MHVPFDIVFGVLFALGGREPMTFDILADLFVAEGRPWAQPMALDVLFTLIAATDGSWLMAADCAGLMASFCGCLIELIVCHVLLLCGSTVEANVLRPHCTPACLCLNMN